MQKIYAIIRSPITLKLSLNILIILFIIFFGFIVGETILPGILSNYISLGKLTGIVFLVVGIIALLAREQNIKFKPLKIKKAFFVLTICLVFLFSFISVFKFGLLIAFILAILITLLFVLFSQYLFEHLLK
jgi:hypothetical protein